jgi:hypothetical protein
VREAPVATADEYTDYMYEFVDRALSEIGPRESCSEAEERLGRMFAEEVEPSCDWVETQEFTCSPKAFLGFFPYLVLLYILGVVAYYIYFPVTVFLSAIGVAVLFFEVVRYRELIDPLFRKRQGVNVAGFVQPEGKIWKQVIVSAHLDSAYEFKVWYWLKSLSVPAMALAFLAPLLLLGASVARTITYSSGVPENSAYDVLGIILLALSPVVILFAFFHTRDVVPGAMDDLAGIGVLVGLARYLHYARQGGQFFPSRTEVVLLALSSEEAGLRGAKRYAARHASEYREVPSYAIFLDNIADEDHLTVFKRELWCGAKMDPYLVDAAERAAAVNRFEIKKAVMAVGATDASAFVRKDIPSVSMCCYNSARLMPNYHTRHDTMEHVSQKSLAVSLQMVIEMIKRIDGPEGPPLPLAANQIGPQDGTL